MTRKTLTAIAVGALAFAAWTSTASAAKHKHHAAATPPTQADSIQGANPMTNAPATPAVEHPAPYKPAPGVNPM
jgi:hypothetical protein